MILMSWYRRVTNMLLCTKCGTMAWELNFTIASGEAFVMIQCVLVSKTMLLHVLSDSEEHLASYLWTSKWFINTACFNKWDIRCMKFFDVHSLCFLHTKDFQSNDFLFTIHCPDADMSLEVWTSMISLTLEHSVHSCLSLASLISKPRRK